jgi:hypothetical protein
MKKFMRYAILVTIFSVASIIGAIGAENLSTNSSFQVHGYWDNSIRDHYLSYRSERAPNKTAVWWSDLDIDFPDFYLGVWGSYCLSDTPSQQKATELDLVIGKRGTISGINYDCQFRYMDMTKMGMWQDAGDCVDFGLMLTGKEYSLGYHNTIQPALDTEWMASCQNVGGGGLIIQPGFIHKWKSPLGIKRLTLVDKDWFCWNDLWFKKNKADGFSLRIDAAMVWTVTKRISFSLPGIRFITPVINPDDGRKTDIQYWTGLRMTF